MARYQMIRGFPFPNVPWFIKENVEKTLDYFPQNDDIIIASYPKTGTNWLQYIILQIVSNGETFPSFNDCVQNKVPFMEMTGPEPIDRMKGLRIYKHHYRYDMVQKNPLSKVLYIYRRPEDTIVSWYHFLECTLEKQINFDEFFEEFLSGNVEYGSYFNHVLSYLSHKDDRNLLFVSYEKLHKSTKEEILRIAKFLSESFYHNLCNDESTLEKIIEHTSFDYMKQNLIYTLPHNKPLSNDSADQPKRVINFFRKGVVGEGRKSLSSDQLKCLQRNMTKIMKGTEVLEEWLSE